MLGKKKKQYVAYSTEYNENTIMVDVDKIKQTISDKIFKAWLYRK